MKRRKQILTLGLAATMALGPAPTAEASEAPCIGDGSYNCAGHPSYGAHSGTWADLRYYGGRHNCTRYAAARLAYEGVPDQGTWGNAREWDTSAAAAGYEVNDTPDVGAIAQWNEGSGLGGYGHVAVVDEVGDGFIIISDDVWGGVTSRGIRLSPDGSGRYPWPDNFIHVLEPAPAEPGLERNTLFHQHAVTGAIAAWEMDGTTINRNGPEYPNSPEWQIVGAADLNNDQSPDLMLRNEFTGEVAVWLFDSVERIAGGTAIPASNRWEIAAVNGTTVFHQHAVTGAIAAWEMDGTTINRNGPEYPNSPEWQIVGAADLNNDQSPDLMLRNEFTGEVAVWLFDSVERIAGGTAIPASNRWEIAAVNGTTVFHQHAVTGAIAAWEMDGTTINRNGPEYPNSPEWQIVGAADLNNDQSPDLMLRNEFTGEVAVWLFDSVERIAGGTAIPASNRWEIAAVG